MATTWERKYSLEHNFIEITLAGNNDTWVQYVTDNVLVNKFIGVDTGSPRVLPGAAT